jgi:uncharacterized membrane protein YqaE (UPF0057 family)
LGVAWSFFPFVRLALSPSTAPSTKTTTGLFGFSSSSSSSSSAIIVNPSSAVDIFSQASRISFHCYMQSRDPLDPRRRRQDRISIIDSHSSSDSNTSQVSPQRRLISLIKRPNAKNERTLRLPAHLELSESSSLPEPNLFISHNMATPAPTPTGPVGNDPKTASDRVSVTQPLYPPAPAAPAAPAATRPYPTPSQNPFADPPVTVVKPTEQVIIVNEPASTVTRVGTNQTVGQRKVKRLTDHDRLIGVVISLLSPLLGVWITRGCGSEIVLLLAISLLTLTMGAYPLAMYFAMTSDDYAHRLWSSSESKAQK